jgi:predicted  nucleic acid-binding Zn-ribbon protein
MSGGMDSERDTSKEKEAKLRKAKLRKVVQLGGEIRDLEAEISELKGRKQALENELGRLL